MFRFECLIFLFDFNQIWVYLTDFHNKSPISNFMGICPVGASLIYADIWTDMMKSIADIRGCTKVLKNGVQVCNI